MNDIGGMNQSFIQELEHFFGQYKKLENKTVSVEQFQERRTAIVILKESIDFYDQVYESHD
jgi:inorganic pyrophosphatase